MTTTRVDQDTLTVSFTTAEKVAGLIRDQRIPRRAVLEAEVVPDGWEAARGLRTPGLALPCVRKLGTWRSSAGKALVAGHDRGPAVRVRLEGQRYATLLLTTADPHALVTDLTPQPR